MNRLENLRERKTLPPPFSLLDSQKRIENYISYISQIDYQKTQDVMQNSSKKCPVFL
jgi:CRISPR/Cas system-associated endonuclease/helicase Cas3